MGLNRAWWVPLLFMLIGCNGMSLEKKHLFEQGYRAGVKEQMEEIAAKFEGGNFPYFHWSAPVVQEVNIPAHIENGMFIPEHKELVIIKPGEWMKDPAYPIQSQENKTHEKVSDGAFDLTAMPNKTLRSASLE
jgi:hypothetical protein